ncbi:SOS response-associated peptidase [Telluribacter sp.]|jgi:putative SOS response-associated peptidase YedK|uniref:SOS response-associated peptidase n=1 Tax=Telluribacter sp. TaxID=1978767 RepID=UPI002E162B60|nr:SOS response-associated peptidase [Telluribacter sp.]
MCYYNSLDASAEELAKRFKAEVEAVADFIPTYATSGFQFGNWPILTAQNPSTFQYLQWGLLPQWVKGADKARQLQSSTLNARSESIHEKPAYRESYRKARRCLIPSTGFFEWQKVGKKKYPYYVSLTSTKIFSIAGLWDEWTDTATGEVLQTFTLITIPANPLMAHIHNTKERMPAILSVGNERKWLKQELSEEEIREVLLPISDADMQAYTVRPLTGAHAPDSHSKDVIAPYTYPELNQQQQSLF